MLEIRHCCVCYSNYCLPSASTIHRLRCPAKDYSFSVLPYCLWPEKRYRRVLLSLLDHQLLTLATPTFYGRLQHSPSAKSRSRRYWLTGMLLTSCSHFSTDYMFAGDSGVLNVTIHFTTLYLACITKRVFGLFLIATR